MQIIQIISSTTTIINIIDIIIINISDADEHQGDNGMWEWSNRSQNS